MFASFPCAARRPALQLQSREEGGEMSPPPEALAQRVIADFGCRVTKLVHRQTQAAKKGTEIPFRPQRCWGSL